MSRPVPGGSLPDGSPRGGCRKVIDRSKRTQRSTTQKELVISLEANVVDPIRQRMTRELPSELLESQRDAVRRTLERFDKKQADRAGNKVVTRK